MHSKCKYLISFFIVVLCCLQQCCLSQSTTVRPYKFGFTIDQQQHRSEKRDERGIVMGEFGFITADGIYHVTVYATDEQGRFRILAMKNYPYESLSKTVEVMVQPKIPIKTTTKPKPLTRHNFNTEACSGCFLKNGNNKPKEANNIQGKTKKSDVRPLSKSLDSSFDFPTRPKLINKSSSETKGNKLMQNNTILPLNTTTPRNAFQHTSILNSPENLQTKTKSQGNTLQNTLSMNSVVQPKVAKLLPLKSSLQTRNANFRSSAKQIVEMPTTTFTKQYATKPTIKISSKDTNETTPQPSTGLSNVLSTSKTTTDNPPPIIDIIMQKVLPTLMDTKGLLPSSITTNLSKKPNVIPSGKNPSGSSTLDSDRKADSSVNVDGDLYRYKYILGYNGHSEMGKRNGNKEGTYYDISDDNVEHSIEYLANEFGYQPRIHWRKLDSNEIKSKEKNNILKDYEFVWFNQ